MRYSVWLILLAAILWGTSGTAKALAPSGAHPLSIGAMRLIVGGVTLFILYVQRQGFSIRIRSLFSRFSFVAAGSIAGFQSLFFLAITETGVAVGTVVAIGSAPIMTGILEWILYRKAPQPNWYLSTLLAIVGCFLLISEGGEISISLMGVVLAIGAAVLFSGYTIASKHLLQKRPSDQVVASVFMLSALILSPCLWLLDNSWVLQWNGWLVVLHLGFLTTAVAYTLYMKGLRGTSSSTAVTLSLAEPLTAAILGTVILGETLTLMAWAGVVLLFLGLSLLSVSPR